MEIRIIEVPPGEAPEHIRRAWVGLVLPLAAGESGRRQEDRATGPFGRLRQWLEGRRWHYVVPADAALNILGQAAPEAAAWWRANAPERIAPDQTFEFPPAACEKMVRLTVGSREIVVGAGPLPVRGEVYSDKTLRRAGPDRLVFNPDGVNPLALLPLILGGIVSLGVVVGALGGRGVPLWPSCGGPLLLALGVWLVVSPWRVEFDRAAGRVRWSSRPGRRRERPLSDVLAVQLRYRRGGRRGGGGRYQVNLVLGDTSWTREQVATLLLGGDDSRAAAAELADFLKVPLLDEVS
jgi:hypothetical protein